MAAFYHAFTSPRTTDPDLPSLLASLRAQDATAGIQHTLGAALYIIKKNTDWTAPQITFAQNAIDTAPDASAQLTAQALLNRLSIDQKAGYLAILDVINLLRQQPTTVFPTITPAQVIQAMVDKAATL